MAWLDNSGLYQKYGLEQTVTQAGGEYRTNAELREIEFDLDLTALASTPTVITGTDNILFPAGVRIEEITVVNKVAATGATSTLDIGLIRSDRSTEIDFNGIVAAAPSADYDTLNERKTYTVGVTGVGALVTAGTVGANPGYLCANYNTAAFTTGVVTVRIKYRKV